MSSEISAQINSFIPSLKREKAARLIIRRELPIAGNILVKQADFVKPDTIVAKAGLSGEVIILRVSESLGIESADFQKSLKVKIGDTLVSGDLICEHRGLFGLFKSRFFAPQEGTIDFISKTLGHIGLRLPSTVLQLNAYSGGKVLKIDPNKAVELETVATIVQGIFGVGSERQGILEVLNISPAKKLELADLPSEIKGKILVGGTLPDIEVLERIGKEGASALIVGGIDDQALAAFLGYDLGLAITGNEKIPFSLMVTEGFGNLAISEAVISLLKPLHGKFACMNGTTQIRAGAIRPELIVPNSTTELSGEPPALSAKSLLVGTQVRLIRVPYFGQIGKITDLPKEKMELENAVVAKVAKIQLQTGEQVVAPIANIEIL